MNPRDRPFGDCKPVGAKGRTVILFLGGYLADFLLARGVLCGACALRGMFRQVRFPRWVACVLLAMAVVLGCGSQDSGRPPAPPPAVSGSGGSSGSSVVVGSSTTASGSSPISAAVSASTVSSVDAGSSSSTFSSVFADPSFSSSMVFSDSSTTSMVTEGGIEVTGGWIEGGAVFTPFEGFKWVSAGLGYACGVRAGGVVMCWSWAPMSNGRWGLDYYTPSSVFRSVDVGWEYACGIRLDWSLQCWGRTPLAGLTPPEGEFKGVSVGVEHACAVSVAGGLRCWGHMERFRRVVEPFRGDGLPLDGPFTDLVSGSRFHCGLRPDRSVDCWGDGFNYVAPPGGEFVMLSASGDEICGIRPSGALECWGAWEESGEELYLSPPAGEFVHVAVGLGETGSARGASACGVRVDTSAVCWGEIKVSLPPSEKFKTVVPGLRHVCGILADGEAKCWRRDDIPENQVFQVEEYPEITPPRGDFTELRVAHEEDTLWCGVRTDGVIDCWGSRYDGHHGRVFPPWGPYASMSTFTFRFNVCAIRLDASLVCWGTNFDEREDTPEGKFKDVSVAFASTCGLRLDGEVECWGGGRTELPGGVESSKNLPPEGKFVSVSAGWDGDDFEPDGDPLTGLGYSCGVRTDAAVECWGDWLTTYGEGSPRGDEFTGVSVGKDGNICVLRTDGVIHCGEDRVYGSDDPLEERFTQISMGGFSYLCGLRRHGDVECWNPDGDHLGAIPGPFTQVDVGYNWDPPYACGLLEDGRIACWDLREEVFEWAANGIDQYTHPQCLLDYFDLHCWDPAAGTPPIVNDVKVRESPILLPYPGSILYTHPQR